MSEAYIGAIQEHCPNAKLVLDRFHIVKALNAAVDEVRKDQWREAAPDERKAMKGLRCQTSQVRHHHRCSVDGWRIDFSRDDAALMASSGIATSISFFRPPSVTAKAP